MRSTTRLLLGVGLAMAIATAVSALAAGVASQRPTPCVESCRATQRTASTRCGDDARCVREAGFAARRCALRCDTAMSPVARCRAECGIDSDRCDAGCQDLPDGERRGCLRRCGSHYHMSCPQSCERRAP